MGIETGIDEVELQQCAKLALQLAEGNPVATAG